MNEEEAKELISGALGEGMGMYGELIIMPLREADRFLGSEYAVRSESAEQSCHS